jgi:hypothetical protein
MILKLPVVKKEWRTGLRRRPPCSKHPNCGLADKHRGRCLAPLDEIPISQACLRLQKSGYQCIFYADHLGYCKIEATVEEPAEDQPRYFEVDWFN